MPFLKLQFRPGVMRDSTNYGGEGGWWDCDKVRFHSHGVESLGGWKKATTQQFYGVCREMAAWATSYSDIFMAMGTHNKLYIEVGGNFKDIHPLRAVAPTITSTTTDNCIATTTGSTTVTVQLSADHSLSTLAGQFVTIAGVSGNVGGIPDAEINANHLVTITDTDSFTFEVATAATSTISAGGGTSITISVEIAPGYRIATYGYGWGTETWRASPTDVPGDRAWGAGSDSSQVFLDQRDWWLAPFDNDLVAHIRDGAIYYWERGTVAAPDNALATRAILLSTVATNNSKDPNAVPVKAGKVVVSAPDKHLIAFGAVPYGSTVASDFDPLLIRWADQDTPYDWTPTSTTTAGSLRCPRGSRIITAAPTRLEHLVWTDTHLYGLKFLGTTDVFGIFEYEENVSIISPRAMATVSSVTYWMGQGKFYAYTGRVETLPCTLLDYVFKNINYQQAPQIVCGTNEEWHEVWWFYCSSTSNWPDRYVVYNHLEQSWYYGTMERTAWLDTNLKEFPQGVTTAEAGTFGTLYNQEDGNDADGVAITSYIQSNDFSLAEGEQYMFMRRLIPDVKFQGSDTDNPALKFQIMPKNFPGVAAHGEASDTQSVIESTVDLYTEQVFIRARARQMALKVQSDTLGVRWHLGVPRIDVRTDGKR